MPRALHVCVAVAAVLIACIGADSLPAGAESESAARSSSPLSLALELSSPHRVLEVEQTRADIVTGPSGDVGYNEYVVSRSDTAQQVVAVINAWQPDGSIRTYASATDGDTVSGWEITDGAGKLLETRASPSGVLCDIVTSPLPALIGTLICEVPGVQYRDGIRWAWYDPVVPQDPAQAHDKSMGARYQSWGGPYEVFDVDYTPYRCVPQEALLASQSAGMYGGDIRQCVRMYGIGAFESITAQWQTRIVWADGTAQTVSHSTTKNYRSWSPSVYHQSAYLPAGNYTTVGVTKEYYPEYCSPPPGTLSSWCQTGTVRKHYSVVPF